MHDPWLHKVSGLGYVPFGNEHDIVEKIVVGLGKKGVSGGIETSVTAMRSIPIGLWAGVTVDDSE